MTTEKFKIGDRVAVCPDYRNKDGEGSLYAFLVITKDHGPFWELEDGFLFCKSTNRELGGVRAIYLIDDGVLEQNGLVVEDNKMISRKAAIINLLDHAYSPEMLEKIMLEVAFIVSR